MENEIITLDLSEIITTLERSKDPDELCLNTWNADVDRVNTKFKALPYHLIDGANLVEDYPEIFEAASKEWISPDVELELDICEILGYTHPLRKALDLAEVSLDIMIKECRLELPKFITQQREHIEESTDINVLNEGLRRLESMLIYNEISPVFKLIEVDIRSKIDYLKRKIDFSQPVQIPNQRPLNEVTKVEKKATAIMAIDALEFLLACEYKGGETNGRIEILKKSLVKKVSDSNDSFFKRYASCLYECFGKETTATTVEKYYGKWIKAGKKLGSKEEYEKAEKLLRESDFKNESIKYFEKYREIYK